MVIVKERRIGLGTKWKQYGLMIGLGVISFGLYVGIFYLNLGQFGFPLDDAWVHQTYARNLAEYGEWAFIPGKISGGSTSPLWTLLLAFVHLLKTGPFWGTFLLSFTLFVLSGVFFQELTTSMIVTTSGKKLLTGIPIFGLFFLLEWRMNWSAVSGMEIIFYIFLILFFFYSLCKRKAAWLPGLLVGLAFWVRPDGITLLGPLYFFCLLGVESKPKKWKPIWQATLAFLPFLILYFVFNQLTAGTWWPNTFYAKQTEYAVLYQTPILQRFLQLFVQPWISAAIIFLPGLFFSTYKAVKNRDWFIIAMLLWSFGYIFLYAVRLPVMYQHSRYLMPTMPVLYSIGFVGTVQIFTKSHFKTSTLRLVKFGSLTLLIALTIGFWVLGINAYVTDGTIIHEEMVEASIWIRKNIPKDEVVAAHDIGALGYYGEHDILDLAGLISPDVMPFIRDEERLLSYMQVNEVHYLMSFSDWYSALLLPGEELYRSDGNAVIESGGQPMVIYRYDWNGE